MRQVATKCSARGATRKRVVLLAFLLVCGCAHSSLGPPDAPRVVMFIPGVAGDGPWYAELKRALLGANSHQNGAESIRVETFNWGAPLPLFVLNFNSRRIHVSAEIELARRITEMRTNLSIVAHSAGCGVALGAIARLDAADRVDHLILLAPSVSPGYDLAAAMRRLRGRLHVFHSDRDSFFLSWRTSTFGTYDGIKSRAAGNTGFDLRRLEPMLARRVVQHAYDPAWKSLGNDGGHDGLLAGRCVQTVIAPLLRDDVTAGAPVSPSAATDP
jgi:hypothetical protein